MNTLIYSLSAFFALGAGFYLFRLFSPSYLKQVNGYHDAENELWHGVCLLGMVGCLTPWVLPLPAIAWSVVFGAGTTWYLLRAFTWGKNLKYNKRWYDLAHAAMLGGMYWMFASPVVHPLVTAMWTAYWLWFGGYYVYRLIGDFKNPHWLGFGQDIAHLVMALVMALMMVWPSTFMPFHNGHSGHGEHMNHGGSGNMEQPHTTDHQLHQDRDMSGHDMH